jgi:hypothetical protein
MGKGGAINIGSVAEEIEAAIAPCDLCPIVVIGGFPIEGGKVNAQRLDKEAEGHRTLWHFVPTAGVKFVSTR